MPAAMRDLLRKCGRPTDLDDAVQRSQKDAEPRHRGPAERVTPTLGLLPLATFPTHPSYRRPRPVTGRSPPGDRLGGSARLGSVATARTQVIRTHLPPFRQWGRVDRDTAITSASFPRRTC
jgi:hypothetical protein